jgi:hypothetical protein
LIVCLFVCCMCICPHYSLVCLFACIAVHRCAC